MMKKIVLFVLIIASIFYSCTNNSEKIDTKNSLNLKVQKGATRVVAVIVSIDSTSLSSDENSPCSKYPCEAEIEIVKVVGKGQGGPIVKTGDVIKARFEFTLGKTDADLFPNMNLELPGLLVGDKFESLIYNLSNTNNQLYIKVKKYNKMKG